ncbi:Uncharacterised protein [BD1-7 clade bacterium]|uniref:PqqC-like protein n=1 Tax=BD1-7 clade bacterium TaxID=2029982 RepID=A0A5S9PM06_9GAMM|nr:Uncharacterised protein [BD1-7 clade bacterium]
MNSPIELLSPDAFSAALNDRVDQYPFESTRFWRLINTGRCPPEMLTRYSINLVAGALRFCATLAHLIETAPNDKARLVLLRNLMEEEGIALKSTRGLVVNTSARHPELAIRFANACGADNTEITSQHRTRPNTESPIAAINRDYSWLESIAYLLVGQELRFSSTSAKIMEALAKQGYSQYDLAFFFVHNEADCRHGQEALDLVIENATTPALQQAALDAASAGSAAWFEGHGGTLNRRHKPGTISQPL